MKDPYGPKRRQTNPLPRVELPPARDGVPDLAERYTDPNAITMQECPACKDCSLCGGGSKPRLVPPDIAKAYVASNARSEDDEEEVLG